ncbi:hypothetical protein CRYUN_Cryun29cG0091800 [Craigia yunnanensis]
MDFDHGNGSRKYSRTDIEENDGSGSSKHSGRHLELVVGSRNSRHSSEESGSSKHSSEEGGSSKHPSRHLKFDDEAGSSKHSSEGSGSSKHSRRHLELDVETGSGKHSDTYPDELNGSRGIESNHFEINPEIIKGWGNNNNFEIHQEVIDGIESSKRSEVIQEDIDMIEGDILVSTEKLRLSSSSSSSSSSSGSSTDDQFQADIKLSKSRSGLTSTSSPKPVEDTQQSFKDKHHVSGNNSSKLEDCQNGSASPTSTSQISTVTHASTLTQSPAIQVMDPLEEFNPYRIPSAVFARSKSTTPMDWSIASNESSFSIQVGSNSFSRDHLLSQKSGELFKSGEFIGLSPSPVAPAVDTDRKSVELDKSEATLVSDDAVKDKTGWDAEEPIGEKPTPPTVSWNSSAISNHSVDSLTSVCSFAFPIRNKKKKQKKRARPSCYSSNCSFCQMEEMLLRKKRQSSSNNKISPWPLQYPQNQLAATVGLGLLSVDGDGTGIGVAVVTVVEETAAEELSSRPLPAEKSLPKSVLYYGMFAHIYCYLIIMTSA